MSKTADRQKWDEMLAEVTPPAAKYTLPELLGDYRAVEGKPGWYLLPLCIEVELRAAEFLGQLKENATQAEQIQHAVLLASCALYRLTLPKDEMIAQSALLAFVRSGSGDILRPAAPAEIQRAFRLTELISLVLEPLDLWVKPEAEGDAKNE